MTSSCEVVCASFGSLRWTDSVVGLCVFYIGARWLCRGFMSAGDCDGAASGLW